MNDVVLKYFYPTKKGNLMIFDAISDGLEPVLLPYEGAPFSPEVFATSVNYGEPAEHSICIGTIKNGEEENTDVLIYRNGDWTPVDMGEEDTLDKYRLKILGGVLYGKNYVIGLAEKVKDVVILNPSGIVDEAFLNETSIEKVTLSSPLRHLTISFSSFSGCTSLKEVNLSRGVRGIEYRAFFKCVNLTDINYDGNIQSWKEINKTSGWNDETGNYVVHCSDGDILKEDDN